MRNVTPPKSKDGRGYDSGISPDSIQDTDARNEYKRMIAANKAKIERYAKQIALYNARWDWIRVIAVFRVDFFNDSTDDVNAIEQLVDLEIKDPGLKKEVTELLAVKKK